VGREQRVRHRDRVAVGQLDLDLFAADRLGVLLADLLHDDAAAVGRGHDGSPWVSRLAGEADRWWTWAAGSGSAPAARAAQEPASRARQPGPSTQVRTAVPRALSR